MTTYALTISTAGLGLGILSNARVTVKRKRTVVSDTFPSANLSSQETVTDALGIATVLLAADDGTVFHEVRIYNSKDMVIYYKALIMPPQAVSLADLPVQDIISAAAADAAAAAAAAAAASIVLDTKKFNTYAEQMAYAGAYVDGQKADVLGYYAIGDGGFIQMYWSASSTATHNGGTVRKPTAVSGAGRWLAINNTASLKQLGAIGNYQYYAVSDWYTVGSARYRGFANLAAVQAVYPHVTAATDSVDFAAIQAAIDASYGKDLVIPTGGYYLRAARADKILNIGDRINIIGSYGTNFIISSYTPNTQDVIQINPLTIADEGVELHNIWVYEQSGSTPARDILRVNLDLTHGLKKLRLFGCLFRTLNGSGRAVRILNPANINANGLFSTNIERSEFSGGLFAEGLGDSVRIKDNTFTGLNIGIDIAMMPFNAINSATAKLSIKDNNITSEGGAIVIRNGFCITIADNNIEQLVDLSGHSCITLFDLDGVSGKSVIMNNKIQPTDPTSKCNGMSLYRCKNTAVVNNQVGTSAKSGSYTCAILVTECENVQVHYNDSYLSDGCYGVIVDAASKNTSYKKGKIRPVTANFTEIQSDSTSTSGFRIIPALLNGWVVAGTGQFQYAHFTKNDGVVSLDGVIARAMTTGDHLIMTLPVGMRPALRIMSICYAYYADGSVGFCNVRVDPDGSVYLSKRSNTTQDILELSLNGINFNAADA